MEAEILSFDALAVQAKRAPQVFDGDKQVKPSQKRQNGKVDQRVGRGMIVNIKSYSVDHKNM
jgi:hypothetical protein